MNTPIISVVVPMYNVERYIKICIDSILAQTFKDFEIIIIDDASTDNSYEICQKLYGDNPKIKILRQKINRGEGATRNTGIANATGKYIYFMDSDDFILPNALEILYNAAESSGAEIVHASRYYETKQDDDKPIDFNKCKLARDNYQVEGFITKDILYRWDNFWYGWGLKESIRSLLWNNLCRREIFEKYPLKFEPINSEDELFYFELFAYVEKFFVINKPFYVYRMREGSVVRNRQPQRLTRGILALFVMVDKIKSVMNRSQKLRGNTKIQEHFIFKSLKNHFNCHIKLFYEDGFSNETDTIVNKILKEVFGENTTFVKFFFHSLGIAYNENELLIGQNYSLIKERLEIEQQVIEMASRFKTSQNKIILVNQMGKGYDCSLKYIAEEIWRQNFQCDLCWLVKDEEEILPSKIRKVLAGNIDMIYEFSTAKIIISNFKDNLPFLKKDDQFLMAVEEDEKILANYGFLVTADELRTDELLVQNIVDVIKSFMEK